MGQGYPTIWQHHPKTFQRFPYWPTPNLSGLLCPYLRYSHTDWFVLWLKYGTEWDIFDTWPVSTPTEYCVSVRLIRHNCNTILDWVSGWPMIIATEYSVRLIRHYYITIYDWMSGWPVITPTEYSVSVRLSQRYCNTILDWGSGWPAITHTEYLVTVRPLRHHCNTILGLVSGWPLIIPTEY